MADNYRFDVAGVSLELALTLAFAEHSKVVGWRVQERENEPPRLILYWADGGEKMTRTPAPLVGDAVVALVQQWVDATPWDPKHPWNEVTTKKGVRVYNEDWGHIDGQWQAFVAIEPYQLWFGK